MKTFLRAASSPNLLEDPSILDAVITTDGWQTLMTFTREMARTYLAGDCYCYPKLTRVFQLHDRRLLRLWLRHLRWLWMKTFPASSMNNSHGKEPIAPLQQQAMQVAAGTSGYVLTARSRTRIAGRIVRFVDCRCRI